MSDNKTYGGITSMKTVDASNYDANAAEFREQLATGKYELDKSFLSPSGAYVLYETGHNHHEAELEAAMALADAGINVTMTREDKAEFAHFIDANTGSPKFVEGKLATEQLTYEQRSPVKSNPKGGIYTVHSALQHAESKRADIALIYDRNGSLHRSDIGKGISHYNKLRTNRFKAIFVVDSKGGVHEWFHTRQKK
ncbi:MAG: hypothetical protein HUK14_05950 [Muribaculaceae bacterium]|nr:hypothetical protein [Muribaculaceae bacterium]